MCAAVSIIIPTLNEAETAGELVHYLSTNFNGCEIIIADGGSTDNTVEFVSGLADIVHSRRGRASQMNAGAKTASGEILWFLHADCKPPARSVLLMQDALQDERIVGGGFRWGLTGDKWYYSVVTNLAHIKNRLCRNLFGDMGIFVRANIFKELRGFAEIPFLEDVEFNGRLRKMGKIIIFNETIFSSDRRLLKKGPMKTFLKNDLIKIAYSFGCSPEFLKKFYYTA